MIIANGTIEFKVKTAGGIDPTTGYAVPSTCEWGEKIPCQYLVNNLNLQSRTNNEHYTQKGYTIYIEQPEPVAAEQLRLCDRDGNEIGEFSIFSIDQLDAVCQTKIIV